MTRTKADYIREYLVKFPDVGPSALAKKLMQDHPQLSVRSQEISTLRARLAQKETVKDGHPLPLLRPAEKETSPDVADAIMCLKQLVVTLGKDQVKRILEVL
jgi:hypothetical protein